VAEIEGRLRSQQKLLGKICGVMFSPHIRLPHELRTMSRARLG
jgi:hypothetical protein